MTIPMAELEIDDVAFLTGESVGSDKQSSCRGICGGGSRRCAGDSHGTRFISCSLTQAFTFGTIGISIIICVALIFAFAHPFNDHCLSSGYSNVSSASSSKKPKAIASQPIATNGEPFPWPDVRLPDFIQPLHYNLFMHPNLTTFTNKGTVDVLLRVLQSVDFLIIHIKRLNVIEIIMTDDKDTNIGVVRHLEFPAHEQLYVQFDRYLTSVTTNYTLKITFNATLEEHLEGFYVTSYIETSTSRKRYALVTHFEPTSARSAFPCFDEPAMKASFVLNMVHDQYYEVYFNSERRQKLAYNPDGLSLSVFDETVRMSTYLVAFVVCDFKAMSARTKEGIHVRVLAPSEQFNQAEFALESATAILSYFQDFFNVTYPLSKLDLIAVPDFGAGAMENWGLITFRTTMILYNPEESSNDVKEQVAVVISHELAHQWFGNLVTMNWWNDLWLNEGFASFVENLGVNFIHPDWKMLDQFITSTTQDALALDSLESSHPIMANVNNPNEIEAIFDAISYRKGASLIHMLENFLNIDILRRGLSNYLNKYKYQNAQTQNLWQSFTEVIPHNSINVSVIMDTWLRQQGFPLVTARFDGYRIHMTQRRFLSSPPDTDAVQQSDISPYGYKWIIPVTIITSKTPSTPRLIWFNSTESSYAFDYSIQWFKINVNQCGFYRVNYDERSWLSLTSLLKKSSYNRHVLSAADRANLIDDAFSLMRIGQLPVDVAMNLTMYLENGERDYVPWETALLHFGILDILMHQNPLLHKYVSKITQRMLSVVGWKDEGTHLMRKLRSSLLTAVVNYGDEPSVRIARHYFEEWMNNYKKIPANLREVVYTTGVQFGGEREWNFCWDKYMSTTVPSEQRLLLGALGATRNLWLLMQYLNYSLDRTKIKPQDTVHVISVVARNPLGRLLAWRFLRQNWNTIVQLFGQGSFSMDTIISETTWHFSTKFDHNEVKTFFSDLDVGSGAQALQQSLERIRANIYWKEKVEDTLIEWLKKVVNDASH